MRTSGVFKRGALLAESASDHALRFPGLPRRG